MEELLVVGLNVLLGGKTFPTTYILHESGNEREGSNVGEVEMRRRENVDDTSQHRTHDDSREVTN